MTVAVATAFDVVPLSKHIGAEIRGLDLHDTLDAETIRCVRQAWLDHAVLLFRGQKLEQEDLLRVTEFFGAVGALGRPPKFFSKGYSRLLPNIMGEGAWDKFKNLKRMVDEISARPAAQKASTLKDRHKFKAEMDDEAKKAMFGHLSQQVA